MAEETPKAKVEPPVPQQILDYKKLLDDYKKEKESYFGLWKVFTENVLVEDFKYSRWAALSFIFIPTLVNVYFLYRPEAIFKNTIRISSILACYFNLHHQLNQDFNALMKKDTPLANRARTIVQNIAMNDMKVPDFGQETYEIFGKKLY